MNDTVQRLLGFPALKSPRRQKRFVDFPTPIPKIFPEDFFQTPAHGDVPQNLFSDAISFQDGNTRSPEKGQNRTLSSPGSSGEPKAQGCFSTFQPFFAPDASKAALV